MGLLDDIVDDMTTLINTDEFGVTAIFDSTEEIVVIFDNPSAPIFDAVTGGVMMPGPQATCKESDVPDAKGKTLKVDDVTYNIIEARPDGTGIVILMLSKD